MDPLDDPDDGSLKNLARSMDYAFLYLLQE